ncbi:hypothetical protein DV711_06315 [Motiliproteus coralliicola]|uniref:Uncharacterized protein n=1 Tax=Motiliproteus coralliicola TaxID=2283196 RepID=A0A369WU29_9GAMM|nr:hypothetical protein [Motiliproteus coralliicola]RDE25167.1 hypothetical protein DV711_06315 [Motiliproteus coralliicola]
MNYSYEDCAKQIESTIRYFDRTAQLLRQIQVKANRNELKAPDVVEVIGRTENIQDSAKGASGAVIKFFEAQIGKPLGASLQELGDDEVNRILDNME